MHIYVYMVVDSLPFLSQIAQKHGFPWCSLGIFDILYFCVLSRQIWEKTKRQIAELQVPVPIHSLMNSLMIWVIANLSILKSVLTDFEFVKCGPAPSTNNKSAFCSLHRFAFSAYVPKWADLESVFTMDRFGICQGFPRQIRKVHGAEDRFVICRGFILDK